MKLNLTIDAALTTQLIESYLKDLIKQQNSNGILLGLSGGIDSSVLATLAVRAVGKERVHASFLFDRDSEKTSEQKARMMAKWLDIKLEVADISPSMKNRNVYAPFIMKLLPYSSWFNRMIQHSYTFMFGETPFKTTLKIGSHALERSWLKRLLFNFFIHHIDHGFSERHIYRRQVLEKKAKNENLTLIGAANLSEFEVGWFIKDGIDDLPIQPMSGLYKTQIWQLAAYLELPKDIQAQLPSPDMMIGFTDEFGIGHNYRRLDQIIDLIKQDKSGDEMISSGISKHELDDIHELMKFSAWKRLNEHLPPPVQGEFGSIVRLDKSP